MEDKNARNSNLEMLRIVSMLLIIAHHYAVHGFLLVDYHISWNQILIDILSLGGKVGVNCFILISGYFMINSKISIKKIWKIMGQVLFYSLGMLILFLFILKPVNTLEFKDVLKSLLPISYSAYTFVTCYLLLMIISPYLNKFIHSLSKKELKIFLIIMLALWSFYITFTNADLAFNEFGWFVVLYCVSAYIKLYISKNEIKNTVYFWLSLSVVLLVVFTVLFNILGKTTGISLLFDYGTYFRNANNILVFFWSVSMFLCFCKQKNYRNHFINQISKYAFGIYLLHDNFLFRPYLWQKIARNCDYYFSNFLIVHAIVSIILIFIFGVIIDFLRTKLVEPLWMNLYQLLERKVKKWNKAKVLCNTLSK